VEQQQGALSQLEVISSRIGLLCESEESAKYLKSLVLQAHRVAQDLLSHSHDPHAYYSNHLVRMLLNDAQDAGLYWVYTNAGQRTNLFNRCCRFAVSDIKTLIAHLQN
jgi:hypothetical protein